VFSLKSLVESHRAFTKVDISDKVSGRKSTAKKLTLNKILNLTIEIVDSERVDRFHLQLKNSFFRLRRGENHFSPVLFHSSDVNLS
jgi:hypothetical protein